MNQKVIEQGERFREMSKEVLPLVFELEKVLKKHGVSCIATLTTNVSSGYFTFSTHENSWELVRSNSNRPATIRYDYSEEIELEETPECGLSDKEILEERMGIPSLIRCYQSMEDIHKERKEA